MDHLGLLLNISELNELLNESASLSTFLDRCVSIVARHFDADVCSIYLYDSQQKCINLASTHGLNKDMVNRMSLKLGEGLTGLAMQELRPIMVAESSKHPGYRYFPGLREELFDAFLAVPIFRGIERIGVLVVQRSTLRPFAEEDQKSLRGVTNQLASMIDYARLLMAGNDKKTLPTPAIACPSFIKGRAASSGWAMGHTVIDTQNRDLMSIAGQVAKAGNDFDFEGAVEATIAELTRYQNQIEERLTDGASLIFAAHILLLKDENFTGAMRCLMKGGLPAPLAVATIAREYCQKFLAQENVYFRQNADDIRDAAGRLIDHLRPQSIKLRTMENGIFVAREILPSDILVLSVEKAAGIVLIGGTTTSHVAILARSLKMPLIMTDNPALLGLTESATLLMDAETGNLFVNPTPAIRAPFEKRRQRWSGAKVITEPAPAESVTLDGHGFSLLANINLISDVDDANAVYAEGIGLYRSEFPFIIRNCFPTEEEQYAVYSTLVLKNGKKPVTLRTLDIGGDKVLSYYAEFKERNPFLGMRSMRFCLQHPDVFKQQLRAILRAGAGADLRIMFPMISSLDEFQDALSVLSECTSELHREAAVFHASPLVGVMIELPSVLGILDSLADKADFFSIGTNDLIQYLLGVDRTNEKVALYYCPHHPSVLRFIKHTADAARKAGIGVTVCGDMAHDPRYARFFLGVGISSLSVDPLYIPTLRTALRSVSQVGAREHAEALLQCATIRETRELISPAD